MVTSAGARGPAVPTSGSHAAHRPLGVDEVAITGGPLGRWQQTNRAASIPLGLVQMEAAGSVPNLRLAAGEADGAFQGYRFQDSDLYKQLEAVAWEHVRDPDPGYEAFVSESAGLLARAQRADGYLNSHYQVVKPDLRYAELEYSHEMYCAGHLLQAAVAAARAGLSPQLLEVARRLADHLVAVFLDGGNDGIDGHPEVETALVELYRLTGQRSYLALAAKLIDNRGKGLIRDVGLGPLYAQDHLPVRHAATVVGHAVRQLYLESGIVDVYLETGDRELLDCSVRRWEDMVATKTYLTGGLGSRHDGEAFGERYELPPDRAYSESCAAIGSLHWNWRLLLATGDGRYADLFERTLYNAFAASTSTDGLRFFYVNPLQRREDHATDRYDGRRREWFSCACCPPNIMRTVASLGHYLATRDGDCLHLHQYAPGTIRSGGVELTVATGYPWDGRVDITVDRAPAAWRLALRIPAWSRSTTAVVDGAPVPAVPDERGYLVLGGPRRDVRLELDMSPRLVRPHPRIDAVRGCAAVERGPLVYCFEQVDQAGDLDEIALAPGAPLRSRRTGDLPGVGPTVLVEADAHLIRHPHGGLPYGTFLQPAGVPVTAVAVPYFQWDNRDDGAMRVWLPLPSKEV